VLDPRFTIIRATSSDRELARQALAEVNLATSHYRGAVDEAALAEFLSDPANYLLVAVDQGAAVGSLYGYVLQTPYRAAPPLEGSYTEFQYACSYGFRSHTTSRLGKVLATW
jgi:hypothetical protein